MNTPKIVRISIGTREILLLGTAHISRESVDQVRHAIISEKPDTVCVELDAGRLDALENPERWKNFDLKQIFRKRQLGTLLTNLLLAAHQKRMGGGTGVRPGEELHAAVISAREAGIPFVLADRDVRISLRRAWACTPWLRKGLLLYTLGGSLFDRTEISEDEMRELRSQDTLSSMLEEFGKSFPELKSVLIDERDQYLASRILSAPGQRILAVVGAGHVPGMTALLSQQTELPSPESLAVVPKPHPGWKIAGWAIPIAIVASLIIMGILRGPAAMADGALFWFLANGIPCALGAMLALAHPLAILTAFAAAAFTSLTPLIGAGYVVAFVQAWFCPPHVSELESLAEDAGGLVGWWKNRMLRILLAFLLPGLGSFAGTWIGGLGIIAQFRAH